MFCVCFVRFLSIPLLFVEEKKCVVCVCVGFFLPSEKNVIVAAVLSDFVKWNEREEYAIQIIALQAEQKNIEQTNKAKEIFFRLAMPAWMKETHRIDRSTNIFVRKFSTGKFILCFGCVCVCAYHYYYIFCARVNDDLIQWNE